MPAHKGLVVCNGVFPGEKLLYRIWNKTDLHVAADGGANCLPALGLKPDAVVGDLDSLAPATRRGLPPESIIQIEEQETNDADKAIRFCIEKGVSLLHLLGAEGNRTDQFIANLDVMHKYSQRLRLLLWTRIERLEFIYGTWKENLRPGSTVSLLPIFGGAHGVKTTGLAYALKEQDLLPGQSPSGVSNLVETSPVSVTVTRGRLLLVSEHHFEGI